MSIWHPRIFSHFLAPLGPTLLSQQARTLYSADSEVMDSPERGRQGCRAVAARVTPARAEGVATHQDANPGCGQLGLLPHNMDLGRARTALDWGFAE